VSEVLIKAAREKDTRRCLLLLGRFWIRPDWPNACSKR